jgi:hypothetical protein
VPRVTGLQEQRGGRVAVEVEGALWRTIPLDAAVRAELRVGVERDRPRRDFSRRALEQQLDRAGFTADEQRATLATLERAGLLDDDRFAAARVEALAERAYGDEAIRWRLEQEGVEPEPATRAIAALAPESARAAAVV